LKWRRQSPDIRTRYDYIKQVVERPKNPSLKIHYVKNFYMGNTPFLARIPEEQGQLGTPTCT
jgi:hypothetical protein